MTLNSFQKCSKSRTWSPRHLVFVFVLQDLDRLFLREVHCGVLHRVRNLAVLGRMFGLHDLCLSSLRNYLRTEKRISSLFPEENNFWVGSINLNMFSEAYISCNSTSETSNDSFAVSFSFRT